MSIVDMICRMNLIVTEIRKCESVYFYCEDSQQIYKHLMKSLYALNKPSALFDFAQENLNENSSIETLKIKLLDMYYIWRNEFQKVLMEYHQTIEAIA